MRKLAVIWIFTLFIVYISAGFENGENGNNGNNGVVVLPGVDDTSSPMTPIGDDNTTPPMQPSEPAVTSPPTEVGNPTPQITGGNTTPRSTGGNKTPPIRGGKPHKKLRLRSLKRWVRDPDSWDFSSESSSGAWRSKTVHGGQSSSSWGSDNYWDSDSYEIQPAINNMKNRLAPRFGYDSDSDDWYSERWDSDSDDRFTISKSAIKTVAPKRRVGVLNNVLDSDSGWYSDDSSDKSDDWYSTEELDGKIMNKIGNNKQKPINKAVGRPSGQFSDSDSEWYSSEEWNDKRINKVGNNKINNNIKAGKKVRAYFSDSDDSDWYSSTSEEWDDKQTKKNGNNKNNNNIKAEIKKMAHFGGSDSDWYSDDWYSDDKDDRNDDNGDDWYSDDNDLWESDSSERNFKRKTANPTKVPGNGKVVIPKTVLSEGWEDDDSDMDDWWEDKGRASNIVRRLNTPKLRSRTAKRRPLSRALGLDDDDTDEKPIPGLKFLGRDDD
ncbi:Hypothetical predicted protein [Mytilus galloprovincialis]|uniref:Uncharacterized protein n=1 Tax=Mytilus galloprovincialis TaxID=29158 RepID=A0A8B6DG50_MYTGA|nr:Hypothetical predicted protein [Mytilus galloprovincialis]